LTYWRAIDMSRHMSERTTVRLPHSLLSQAKRKAAAEGRTLTALIEEGLHLVLAQSSRRKTKPLLPRVSKATGGPMPGVDFTSFSALQELDDLEYVERMKNFK
jgi:hypothetical protein